MCNETLLKLTIHHSRHMSTHVSELRKEKVAIEELGPRYV